MLTFFQEASPIRMIPDLQIIDFAREVIKKEELALSAAREVLGCEFLDAVTLFSKLTTSSRVVVLGVGKSGLVGRKISATLASTGTPSIFIHPADAGHGDLGMVTKVDAVLAISQSGETSELLSVIPFFKRNGIPIVAMTSNPNSTLGRQASVFIDTSVVEEACPLGLAPTASTTLVMALGDALALYLLRLKGFTESDFVATHPHGSLGLRKHLRVKDVMSRGDDIPRVKSGSSLKYAIVEMSRGRHGYVSVIGASNFPVGIFTDGDLRRLLQCVLEVSGLVIDDVMVSNFKSVGPEDLAVEAVEIMDRHAISSLPVLTKNRELVGSINLASILRTGII